MRIANVWFTEKEAKMTFDTEMLKVFGTTVALLVSTATVQYKLADFINAKRDKYPDRRVGKFVSFGEFYDWLWGYLLGIFVNVIFLLIACKIKKITSGQELSLIGLFLFIFYLGNVGFWVIGLAIDGLRMLRYPGQERQ